MPRIPRMARIDSWRPWPMIVPEVSDTGVGILPKFLPRAWPRRRPRMTQIVRMDADKN